MSNQINRWIHLADLRFDETTPPGQSAFIISNLPVLNGLADPGNPFFEANRQAIRTNYINVAPPIPSAQQQKQPLPPTGPNIEQLRERRMQIALEYEAALTSAPDKAAGLEATLKYIDSEIQRTEGKDPKRVPRVLQKYVFEPLDRHVWRPFVANPSSYVGTYSVAKIEAQKGKPLWRQILAGPEGFFGGISDVLTLQHLKKVQKWEESLAPGTQQTPEQQFAQSEIGQVSPGQSFALAARQYASQVAPGATEAVNLWADQVGLDALMLGGRNLRDFSASEILAGTSTPDELSRYMAAQGDQGFKWQSGINDAMLRWFGDPTILIGKTGTALRVNALDRAVVGPAAARAYVESKQFNTFLDRMVGKSYDQIMANKAILESPHGSTLAALFSRISNRDHAKLVGRAAYGDTAAFAELATVRADLAFQMGRFESHRIDRLYDAMTVSPTNIKEAIRRFDAADEIDDIIKELRATGRFEEALDRQSVKAAAEAKRADTMEQIRLLELADEKAGFHGALRTQPGGVTRRLGEHVRYGIVRQEFFQDNILSRPISFTRHLFRYRPGFTVDLNRPTGVNDISRVLDKAGVSGAMRDEAMMRYASAGTPGQRLYAAEHVDETIFQHLGASFGYKADEVATIYHQYAARKGYLHGQLRSRIYAGQKAGEVSPVALIDENGLAHNVPVSDAQLADVWSLPDVDLIKRSLKDNAASFRAVRNAGYSIADSVTTFGDAFNRLWKFSALFRVGYPIRALSDPELRAIAMLGGMTWMSAQSRQAYNAFMRGSVSRNAKKAYLDAETTDALLGAANVKYPRPGFETPMVRGRELPSDFGRFDDPNQFYRVADQAGQYARFVAGETQVFLDDLRSRVGDWRTLTSSDPEFWTEWATVANNQLANSKIVRRILRYGEDETAKWLKEHPAGQRIRRQLPWWETEDDLVMANSYLIDHYLTTPELREMVNRGDPITSKFLKDTYEGTVENQPAVHAQMAKWMANQGDLSDAINKIYDKFYSFVNRIPERQLFAHPVHNAVYKSRLRELVEQYPDEMLTDDIIDNMSRSAREFALKEMKRIVYDISRQPNAVFMIRWLAPFFGAYWDSMRAWTGLIWDDMSIPGKAHLMWDAPNKAGIMVDENGNQLGPDEYDPDARMMLPVIGPMKEQFEKTFGISPQVGMRKQSFMVMLSSGDYWWAPGAGPGVSVPVNEIAKRKPTVSDDNAFLRWALPFGIELSPADVAFPISINRIRQALSGVENQDFANSWATIYNVEFTKYRQGTRSQPPTIDEVTSRARNLSFLRLATNLISPVGMQYTSPYQFYIDQYRKIQDTAKTPYLAQQTFLNLYGDEFEAFTKYMSRNRTGVRSSIEAVAGAKRYRDIISEVPELGWLVLGPENTGKYSSSARSWLFSTPVVPGGAEKFRELISPEEYARQLKADEGWRKYSAVMTAIEAERVARGLKTIYSTGGEDLAELKRGFTLDLTTKNLEWAKEFGARDETYIRRLLPYLGQVVNDPRLEDRSDLMVLHQYLELRDAIVRDLRARAAVGMARTTESAIDNADLAGIWNAQVPQYIEANTLFGDIYNRLLDRDEVISADDPLALGE